MQRLFQRWLAGNANIVTYSLPQAICHQMIRESILVLVVSGRSRMCVCFGQVALLKCLGTLTRVQWLR